ncbi:hypothetical protein PEC18_04730 [Paucibacter sp. O1-1]|nr:hypothetical protein [Paucibacter sp. O1-1]MDA3825176.1 hypothetical protein [Paucibacter sp. O1-1]
MKQEEVIEIVHEGLKILEKEDDWLLENDLSERSIAQHRLACHLQHLFDGYCVDCEYNGAMRGEVYARKKVQMVKEQL